MKMNASSILSAMRIVIISSCGIGDRVLVQAIQRRYPAIRVLRPFFTGQHKTTLDQSYLRWVFRLTPHSPLSFGGAEWISYSP